MERYSDGREEPDVLGQINEMINGLAPEFGIRPEPFVPSDEPLSIEQTVALGFLIMHMPSEDIPDEEAADHLWRMFPRWKLTSSFMFSLSKDMRGREFGMAIGRINFSHVVEIANSQAEYFEGWRALSEDSDIAPPPEQALQQWSRLRRITASAQSRHPQV